MPTKLRRGLWIPGCGIMNGYVSPWGCWKLNLDPLQEQEALLMIDPFLLSSISPPCIFFHFLFTLCLVILGQRLSFALFYVISQQSQCSPDIMMILFRWGRGDETFQVLLPFFFEIWFPSLVNPGWPGIPCVDQSGLEFTEIHLLLPPQCWDLSLL